MRDDGRKTGFNKRKDTVLGTNDKRREREREKRRARELKGGECMRREEGVKEKEKRIRDGSAG